MVRSTGRCTHQVLHELLNIGDYSHIDMSVSLCRQSSFDIYLSDGILEGLPHVHLLAYEEASAVDQLKNAALESAPPDAVLEAAAQLPFVLGKLWQVLPPHPSIQQY